VQRRCRESEEKVQRKCREGAEKVQRRSVRACPSFHPPAMDESSTADGPITCVSYSASGSYSVGYSVSYLPCSRAAPPTVRCCGRSWGCRLQAARGVGKVWKRFGGSATDIDRQAGGQAGRHIQTDSTHRHHTHRHHTQTPHTDRHHTQTPTRTCEAPRHRAALAPAMVNGQRSTVNGQWSTVNGQRSTHQRGATPPRRSRPRQSPASPCPEGTPAGCRV
jgi:hypothetical protein